MDPATFSCAMHQWMDDRMIDAVKYAIQQIQRLCARCLHIVTSMLYNDTPWYNDHQTSWIIFRLLLLVISRYNNRQI